MSVKAWIGARVLPRLRAALGVTTVEHQVALQAELLDTLLEAHGRTAQTADHALEVAGDGAHAAVTATAMARQALDGTEQLPSILEQLHLQAVRVGAEERMTSIVRTTAWLQMTGDDLAGDDVSVSVVMPTRNRAEMVRRSVPTVVAQSHSRWELLIGDDGSDDDTPKVIDALAADDERIRAFRFDHGGVSATRNQLLAQATGDVVVYLDDDNLMAPSWLRAVAWCFAERADVDVAYGARLIDNPQRLWGASHDGSTLPAVQFAGFDRARLEQGNTVDMGCIAHRRSLPEAGFDERLHRLADWDLFLRLTADGPPFELPVVAIAYFTDAPDRVSVEADEDPELAIIRAKLAGRPAG